MLTFPLVEKSSMTLLGPLTDTVTLTSLSVILSRLTSCMVVLVWWTGGSLGSHTQPAVLIFLIPTVGTPQANLPWHIWLTSRAPLYSGKFKGPFIVGL